MLDARQSVSRNLVDDEGAIQISQVAIDICQQLQEVSTLTESDAQHVVYSPQSVRASIKNKATQQATIYKRATIQLTPQFTPQGEEVYLLVVMAILDQQLKTLIKVDLRDIERISVSSNSPRQLIISMNQLRFTQMTHYAKLEHEDILFKFKACDLTLELNSPPLFNRMPKTQELIEAESRRFNNYF